ERRIERSDRDTPLTVAHVDPAASRIPVANGAVQLMLVRRAGDPIQVDPEPGLAERERKGNVDGLRIYDVLLLEQPIHTERAPAGLEQISEAGAAHAGGLDLDGDRRDTLVNLGLAPASRSRGRGAKRRARPP